MILQLLVTALFVVLWLLVARPPGERIGKPTIRRRHIHRPGVNL